MARRPQEPPPNDGCTMTSQMQDDENRPLGDHELDVIHGGFFLMELLVQINQVAIIIGMNVPTPQKVRNA